MAVITTAVVTVLSYALPRDYAATGVGFAFLVATYFVAMRGEDPGEVRRYGLALGGLLEPSPIEWGRLAGDASRALGWALLLVAIAFPPFWVGYVLWWTPPHGFDPAAFRPVVDDAPGQLLVIALPEEAFFRGYLQTALDDVWRPRWRALGGHVGPGLLVASGVFALGHVLTEVDPNRLAVFFPALVFGWLRARTGGIGASIVFHALCNLFASYLARSYGFSV